MTEIYEAIVVGGGIVGCSVLYGLAERGMTNTLLLEKNELTSGSTWHAAGNCTHFGHDAAITRLYVESLETYERAERETGQSIGFHKTGSLRLASSQEELLAYESLIPTYEALGVPYEIVGTKTILELHPLMNIEGVLGAAYTPNDGHVDPTGATMAMANAARAHGAKIRRHSPVNRIQKLENGNWDVHSNGETYETEQVIIATSFWAREMLSPLGVDLPLYAMEHHEIVTEAHPK